MLPIHYDPLLVVASVLVAMMAAFTALTLTRPLAALGAGARKVGIAKAAICLGGGIWAMHFIGMLAVSTTVPITYDTLRTVASALIAILITGFGLLLLFFGGARRFLLPAGGLTGIGIVVMHFVGMSAIAVTCTASTTPLGYVIPTVLSVAASTAAFWIAGEQPGLARLVGVSTLLGLTVSGMHYSAMAFTTLWPVEAVFELRLPALSDGLLALVVLLVAFVICGLFLVTATPIAFAEGVGAPAAALAGGPVRPEGPMTTPPAPRPLAPQPPDRAPPDHERPDLEPPHLEPAAPEPAPPRLAAPAPPGPRPASRQPALAAPSPAARPATPAPAPDPRPAVAAQPLRLPVERNRKTVLVTPGTVRYARATGHYTLLCDGAEELFCPWPISRLERALEDDGGRFLRVHRSYLVNLDHLEAVERDRDKAWAVVAGCPPPLGRVPVSRHRLTPLRDALGL